MIKNQKCEITKKCDKTGDYVQYLCRVESFKFKLFFMGALLVNNFQKDPFFTLYDNCIKYPFKFFDKIVNNRHSEN